MKKKITCIAIVLLASITFISAKKKDKAPVRGIYMAGVAASFTDTLVFITDAQYVQGAVVNGKGLLEERNQYSNQLKDYVEERDGLGGRTACVFFATDEKKLQKKMTKVRSKYQKSQVLIIKNLPSTEFQFKKATLQEE